MPNSLKLRILNTAIEKRCQETAESYDWPCSAGCNHCCRSLSDIPAVTLPEWTLILEAYLKLPDGVRGEIRARLECLGPTPPFTCPFLDLQVGRCRIYEARPVACRTYGFYRERDWGLYCGEMLARAEQGEWQDVVWGNGSSVEAALDEFGERKDLKEWYALQDA